MKIIYLCPAIDIPIGGIKVIYKHVDILNQIGYDAYVYHDVNMFRCTWFRNTTRIVYYLDINDHDIIVVPETMAHLIFRFKCKKIIFNQNVYNTFQENNSSREQVGVDPYRIKDLFAVMVVSEDNYAVIKEKYPEMQIYIVRNCIDKQIFSYDERKVNQICYMSRKNKKHIEFITNMLNPELLVGWKFVDIDGCNENETAQIMKESKIFLSVSDKEGFGLPAAEALATGCMVVGYNGKGGKEYFDRCCITIDYGNIELFVKEIENIVHNINCDANCYKEVCKKNSVYILGTYSGSEQMEDLRTVIGEGLCEQL